MQLPGRLRGTTLGDVLGRLHRDGATGVLELIETAGPEGGRSHRIRLEAGLVCQVESEMRHARLGEILQEQGHLPAGAGSRVAAAAQSAGRSIGRHLVERAALRPEQVSRALREQVRRRLEKLFALEDALVRFHVPRPRLRDATEPRPLSAPEFLHGRPRARGRDTFQGGAGAGPGQGAQGTAGGPPSSGARQSVRSASARGALRVLGLEPGATFAEVKVAFRRLAAENHPDRCASGSPAERQRRVLRLTELTSAYHELLALQFAPGA